MATKVKGDKIKEGSIPLSALDDKLEAEINSKYGLSGIVCILNSNNTTSDIFPIGDYFVYVSSKKTIIELNIGGRTDLSRLNGPYTVITSEVISGSKVKFSVSGGDISYYGNLIIGNKYNEVPTPTPDWNAQEGEAGYIENRTHFAKYIPIPKDASVVIDVPCTYDHDRGVHYLLKDIVVEYKYYYMTEYNKVIIPAGTDINGSVYVEAEAGGGPVTLEFSLTYDNGVVNIRIIRAPNYDFRVVIYNMLDDIYLPDTVLKTTPQTLSDTAKNQVKENLGISTPATPDWNAQEGEEGYIANKPNLLFEKGDAENSAVLKGEYQGYSNKAISQTSMAIGAATTAGLKGYYINYATATIIYISEVNTELLDSEPSIDNNFINPYEVGDVYSVHYGTNYYNVGTITSIDHNKIVVDSAIIPTKDARLRYHFYVFDKADKGVVDIGECAYAEGIENKAYNVAAHAEGRENKSLGKYSHTEGKENEAHYCAHAEGSNNKSIGNTSHTEGTDNIALNSNAHAEGRYTTASGYASHAEGYGENINNRTVASGDGSHAEGRFTEASGKWSHTEGEKTKASGLASHAEGLQTRAEGQSSHAEGRYTYAKGAQSHAEGYGKQDGSTGAFGSYSHSEGQYTTASGNKSHSEGTETNASADSAHAEGLRTAANGMHSHAEGRNTITNNEAEHASGQYNVSILRTAENTTAEATQFSIGIGTSDTARKNAFEVKQNGDIYIEGVEGRIQDKLNTSTSVTLDWEAKEGEAGYIENKPFSINHSGEILNDNFNINSFNPVEQINLYCDNFDTIHVTYNFDIMDIETEAFIKNISNTVILKHREGISSDDIYFYNDFDGSDFSGEALFINIENLKSMVSLKGYVTILINPEIKTLDSVFLPNTVIKTTPQTLSDTDKNQAFANLGIDPVVWKYICKPYIFNSRDFNMQMPIPSELMQNGKLKYKIPAMYRINLTNQCTDPNSGEEIDFPEINNQYGEYTPETVTDNRITTAYLNNDYSLVINITATGTWNIQLSV